MTKKRQLTPWQLSIIAEVVKHGAPFVASAIQRHWEKGERYYIDTRVGIPTGLRKRFERENDRFGS